MKSCKTSLTVSLAISLVLFLSTPLFSYSRDEMNNYKDKELMAPDFSLRGLDGSTHTLSDFRGKKVVVIQTGSST